MQINSRDTGQLDLSSANNLNEGSDCPTPQKKGLSPFECIYGRPFLHTDIVIGPEGLELTSYVTQLSAFQQSLTELWETTPDPTSESNKPLFEPRTEVLIKTLGSGGPSLEPLWEGP